MIISEIRDRLFALRDVQYLEFQSKLIPTVEKSSFVGVRTPELRSFAKELSKRNDVDTFLSDLPHRYFDENQLHAFIISLIKDFDTAIAGLNEFLPYIDNWATCDQLSPKAFKKHTEELLPFISDWLNSPDTYTVRFGIKMLMEHFLDDAFSPDYLNMVASVRSDEYYINMMIAWYFATALAKQYDSAVIFLKEKKLDTWTHNKTIQKSIESFRISPEQKEYLRTLKISGK